MDQLNLRNLLTNLLEGRENRYESIKQHGYYIDTRSTHASLFKGMNAWRFSEWKTALTAAETDMATGFLKDIA